MSRILCDVLANNRDLSPYLIATDTINLPNAVLQSFSENYQFAFNLKIYSRNCL